MKKNVQRLQQLQPLVPQLGTVSDGVKNMQKGMKKALGNVSDGAMDMQKRIMKALNAKTAPYSIHLH